MPKTKSASPQPFSLPLPPSVAVPLPIAVRLKADTSFTGIGTVIAMVDSDFGRHADLEDPVSRVLVYYDAVNDIERNLPPNQIIPRRWHGTMAAHIAAGNGFLSGGRYTSLAPNAGLVMIRTMDNEGTIPTQVICRALSWILVNFRTYRINIVNISVYADEYDQTLSHPVNHLVEQLVSEGITVVAAAGNNPDFPIRPPAAAPSAISVGGLDDKNSLNERNAALYHGTFGVTTLGIQKPDVIAPAIYLPGPILYPSSVQRRAAILCSLEAMPDDMLLAVYPQYRHHATLDAYDSLGKIRAAISNAIRSEQIVSPWYKMIDGTSFAAPIVSSIVAQMLQANPNLTPHAIRQILTSTARLLPETPHLCQGAGIVQQRAAISRAVG